MQTRPSFDERFQTLAAIAYRVGFRLVGDRDVAEDLAQEALARAFPRWDDIWRYDEAWVVRVTSNLAIGRWRRRTPNASGPEIGASADAGLGERLDLQRALRSLPRRQREAVVLRHLGDLSERQTAEALGCSVGAVKQHTRRGLAALRLALAEASPGDNGTAQPTEEPHVSPS
jgi:RNA polymerase sigma-70 factor (sigma-E family)